MTRAVGRARVGGGHENPVAELGRRNVYRVAVVYIVVSWLLLQVGDFVFGILEAPAWVMKAAPALLVLGFPLAVALARANSMRPSAKHAR